MLKKAVRELYKQKRRELSPLELDNRSEKICVALFSRFQLEGKTVSLFLPIERQKEINTYHILEKGMSIGTLIALPKTNTANHSMKHYLFENQSQLALNELGIPEPTSGKMIKPEQLDFVFVPLLAVDKTGHRIGYGKGYYDRFLKKCSPHCQFVGLHLFDEFIEIEDVDTHDIQLDYCITPEKIIRFDNK
jgi:5-formyltetrahydrofolate cyclo-ligase